MLKATLSVRARILAIALIPSVALLAIGVGAASYLLAQGMNATSWTSELKSAQSTGTTFVEAVQEERRLTLLTLAGDQQAAAALPAQRDKTNAQLKALGAVSDTLTDLNPGAVQQSRGRLHTLSEKVGQVRVKVDNRAISARAAYTFFNQLLNVVMTAMQAVARNAPDASTAYAENTVTGLFQVAEALSRSNAMAAAVISPGTLTDAQLREYARQVGSYHVQLRNLVPNLTAAEQAQYQKLVASPAWKRLSAMESAIIKHGGTASTANLPLGQTEWQNAASQVRGKLLDLWSSHNLYAQHVAAAAAHRTVVNSLWVGGAVLLIAILAFLVALWMSNRLISRLTRLRGETLTLADEKLPDIMSRLREGKSVDPDAEVSPLDHGRDEIGQVAEAFNKAQRAAVAAAVTEAKTREGVNAVFLNIAHRSQVVVHRQLEVLDKAEYTQEDPDHLDMLFQLDHLATRERRNAENLIILGGEQPGRQWRNPVPLLEIVRSAVAETEDYARVRTGRLPDVSVVGNVVADLIHLLAELVDNATSFSPPESRVEVSGNVVGKGVVVEIIDQGLGMPQVEIARINKSLREPPDFSVTTLSSDSRLGMFVVAQLAARNDVSIRFLESDYGGIRVIVLIPTNLLAAEPTTAEAPPQPRHEETAARPRRRRVPVPADERPRRRGEPVDAGRPEGAVSNDKASVGWPTQEPPVEPRPPAPRQPLPARGTPRPANGQPVTRGARERPSADEKPALPRRRRQESLSPQLARSGQAASNGSEAPQPDGRTADDARDMFSAIENGTRQGRQAHPDRELIASAPDERDEREGHDT